MSAILETQPGKRKILMFAPYSFPPICAESIATSKFIYALLKKGWKIDVIAFSGITEWYPRDESNKWVNVERVVRLIGSSQFPGVRLKYHKLDSIQWVFKAIIFGFKLLRSNKYDFILSRATPLFGHLPALIVHKKAKIPWIANWSDPLPQDKAPPPYGDGPNTELGIFRNIYLNLISRYAHCHTFPCERLSQYYNLYLPHTNNKCWVVPHIALSDFQANIATGIKKFVICYSGSLAFRPVDILFKGLRNLSDKIRENIFFQFIVSNEEELSNKAYQYGIASQVTVGSNKTYQQTQSIMCEASVLLIIEAQCDEGIFFPSKVADIVQTGKPILAISPRKGVLNDLITLHGGGIVVDNQCIDSVTTALETLFQAWANGKLQEDYGSSHLMNLFGEEVVLEKFDDVVKFATKGK